MDALLLDPVLDMRAAAPLKAALAERRGKPVELDASKVQRLGGLCLQVLIAARRAWHEEEQPLVIGHRSEAFTTALRLFGATEQFEYMNSNGGIQ